MWSRLGEAENRGAGNDIRAFGGAFYRPKDAQKYFAFAQ